MLRLVAFCGLVGCQYLGCSARMEVGVLSWMKSLKEMAGRSLSDMAERLLGWSNEVGQVFVR